MAVATELSVEKVDILVVGSGGAGMRAAIEARACNLGVTILAKGPVRANHTRMSGGRYNVVTGLNPDDSSEIFFRDTLDGGANINNEQLVEILVDEALDRVYDLEEYGLLWERASVQDYLVVAAGGGSRLRTIGSFDEGIGITEVMLHRALSIGVEFREFQMLVDVVPDDDGRVIGALALDLAKGRWVFYDCGAVIIATGGTSQLYETNSGPAINTGDGIAIAFRAGAELVDIEFMQFIPIAFVYPPSIKGYTLTEPQHYGKRHYDVDGEPGKLLNAEGKRFMLDIDPQWRESGTRDILARSIMLEILEGRGTPEGGVWLEPDPEVFEKFCEERPIYSKRIRENYGERAARFQEPLQVMPSALYTTGGIRIDEDCRTSVPGLLAAGEAAGGIHGANRLGGNSMPDIQVFGRRAGISAAQEAKERVDRPAPDVGWARGRSREMDQIFERDAGVRPPEVKQRIQKLMWEHIGLVRSGRKLDDSMADLREIREHVLPQLCLTRRTRVLNREWMEAIELENMIDIAEAMCVAALARTETRGAHYRQDFPDRNDAEWLANLYVRRDDKPVVEKRAVIKRQDQADHAIAAGKAG